MSGLNFAGLPFSKTGRAAVMTEDALQAVVLVSGVGKASCTLLSWPLFNNVLYLVWGFGQDAGAEAEAAVGMFLELTIQITFLHLGLGVPGYGGFLPMF